MLRSEATRVLGYVNTQLVTKEEPIACAVRELVAELDLCPIGQRFRTLRQAVPVPALSLSNGSSHDLITVFVRVPSQGFAIARLDHASHMLRRPAVHAHAPPLADPAYAEPP